MRIGIAIEDMVGEEYLAIVKRLRPKDRFTLTSLRSFRTWFLSHGLAADAHESLPEVAPESTKLYRTKPGASRAIDSSTAALAAALRPASSQDVRCVPRVLRAVHQDAGFQ